MRTPDYRLVLNGRLCISCGICMDLCPTRAIAMRFDGPARTIEGAIHSHGVRLRSGSREVPANDQMTYPYLGNPSLCNACRVCIQQCPVSALTLMQGNQVVEGAACQNSRTAETSSNCHP